MIRASDPIRSNPTPPSSAQLGSLLASLYFVSDHRKGRNVCLKQKLDWLDNDGGASNSERQKASESSQRALALT